MNVSIILHKDLQNDMTYVNEIRMNYLHEHFMNSNSISNKHSYLNT